MYFSPDTQQVEYTWSFSNGQICQFLQKLTNIAPKKLLFFYSTNKRLEEEVYKNIHQVPRGFESLSIKMEVEEFNELSCTQGWAWSGFPLELEPKSKLIHNPIFIENIQKNKTKPDLCGFDLIQPSFQFGKIKI